MKSQTRHPILRATLVFGIILLTIHSFLTLCMFLYVYSQRGIAQAELAWATFFLLDFPTPQLTFQWLASTSPMRALFDWGYYLVGSGPNLRTFAMVGLAGGLHWLLVGLRSWRMFFLDSCALGLASCCMTCSSILRNRLTNR